jgi:hypothetical protein
VKYLSIIEDYFLGNLKGEALKDFIAELNSNTELSNEYKIYKRAHDFVLSQENRLIRDINKLTDFELDPDSLNDIKKYGNNTPLTDDEKQLSSILQSENINYNEGNKKKLIWTRWAKAAAILALIIGLGITGILIYSDHYTDEELFIKFYTPYEPFFTSRSLSSNMNSLFLEGTAYYEKGDYNLAITRFEKVSDSLKIKSGISLFEGICFIELKDYNRAIDKFEEIDEDNLLFDASLWYQGLCYLKLDDKINARRILQILKFDDTYYQKQAKKLLKYLRR